MLGPEDTPLEFSCSDIRKGIFLAKRKLRRHENLPGKLGTKRGEGSFKISIL